LVRFSAAVGIALLGASSRRNIALFTLEGDASMRNAHIVLAVAIALLISTAAVAQEKKKRTPARKLSPTSQAMLRMHMLHKALEELDLTDEQKQAHKKVHEEIGPKMKEIMDGMKEILSEEQVAALEEAGKKAKEAGKTGRAMFVAIESALKLTDEQKEKMKEPSEKLVALQKQAVRKVMAILTPEQKEEIRAKMAPQRKRKAAAAKKKKEG
jgi:hypothetical protein